jgi:signal peptidase II
MSSIPVSRHLLFWSLAAIGLAADLGTKAWMFSRQDLLAGQIWWIWPNHIGNHVGFQLSLNQGALFGMGQGNVWLFAACSIAAAIAIPAWLFVLGGAHDRALTIVLGCILGGVIGNLYDRVGLPGLEWDTLEHLNYNQNPPGRVYAVRDFVLLARQWPPRSRWDVWPNFNLADSLLVCGAIALLVLSMRKPSAETTAPTSGGATVGR